jgi:hypothetical protein
VRKRLGMSEIEAELGFQNQRSLLLNVGPKRTAKRKVAKMCRSVVPCDRQTAFRIHTEFQNIVDFQFTRRSTIMNNIPAIHLNRLHIQRKRVSQEDSALIINLASLFRVEVRAVENQPNVVFWGFQGRGLRLRLERTSRRESRRSL